MTKIGSTFDPLLNQFRKKPMVAAAVVAAVILIGSTIALVASRGGSSTDNQACSAGQPTPLTGPVDGIELNKNLFACADEAIVVDGSESVEQIQAGAAQAIEGDLPFFVRTEENSDRVDAELSQLGASAIPPTNGEVNLDTIVELFSVIDSDVTYVLSPTPSPNDLSALPALFKNQTQIAFIASGDTDELAALADRPDHTIVLSDDFDATDQWITQRAVTGLELPGGGYTLFPDRRIVAFYGNPTTSALGLLGEQDAAATVERLKPKIPEYEADDIPVIGGFEIIATVASVAAGDDDNYSNEMDPDVLRPWIEEATKNGLYVILDLQPGRTDFLTQAKIYEEFLMLPNVGLALDPEWRIGPDEKHLVQVGSVEAAEVNQVVDYLVQLVQENDLPQKALVLHQFQTQMLRDRETIKTPPELAVTIHADGQGPLSSKFGTWDKLRSDPIGEDQALWWAWKNFIDEDSPTATPQQVNEIDPLPVIVTYQ